MGDWIEAYEPHPWCNGRLYCNAPAVTKTRCLLRPPPHWWIVELDGAIAPFEYLNDTYVLPYWRTRSGKDPMSNWENRNTPLPQYQLSLLWQPVFGTDPMEMAIVVALDIFRNLLHATSWKTSNIPVIGNWFVLDDLGLIEQTRSPLWQAGDIECRIYLGTYDRLPAHSCRGDYQGVWP